ncbi:hypothetical protein ZIOFF_061042 [Zingiber officinale]|uniref:adenylate kinase n=1 Tax=Zingiber officinale TaxID=94328 RepID=A0A8J5KMH5_ZINOF|nr:hypothetical protein ZIOFF_061042 [Zingiber officinale]
MAAHRCLLRSSVLGSSPAFSAGKRGFSVLTEEPVARLSAGLSASGGSDPTPRRREARNVQWVFLGCPGVGKGTFTSRLSQLLGVPHTATGDLVREELASSGPLSNQLAEIVNQGQLVSDKIIINLLSKSLESGAAKGESGFIHDGFPRTVKQAVCEKNYGVTTNSEPFDVAIIGGGMVGLALASALCRPHGDTLNAVNGSEVYRLNLETTLPENREVSLGWEEVGQITNHEEALKFQQDGAHLNKGKEIVTEKGVVQQYGRKKGSRKQQYGLAQIGIGLETIAAMKTSTGSETVPSETGEFHETAPMTRSMSRALDVRQASRNGQQGKTNSTVTFVGDINAYLSMEDTVGGLPLSQNSFSDFQNFVVVTGLKPYRM